MVAQLSSSLAFSNPPAPTELLHGGYIRLQFSVHERVACNNNDLAPPLILRSKGIKNLLGLTPIYL